MELETKRLRLRPFDAKDLPQLQRYAVRPEFFRFLPIPAQTPETVAAFLKERLEDQSRGIGNRFTFALELTETKTVIGSIRIEVQSSTHRHGDFGIALDSDYQGHGYMTEAMNAVLDMGFDQLKLHRIWATADIRNERSWRLMERIGMQRDGLLREHRLVRGRWRDSYLYSILATDVRP